MDEQIECIKMFHKKLNKTGRRIFDLEIEIIKLRAELEVEKRYTQCLENVLKNKKGE